MFGASKYNLHHIGDYDLLKIDGKETAAPVVLIHGMFGGLSNFDALLDRMQSHTIYVPKIPFYELDKSSLTIPRLADWLDDFITALNIEYPVLLGNSIGGHIALEYARTHPQKLNALVLTGSSGLLEYDFGSSWPKRGSRKYLKDRANMTFYEDLANDVIVDEILEVVNSRKKSLRLLKLTRSTHAHNMEEMLPQIKQPTLLVWGRQDVVTPPEVARQFEALLPHATLAWIDRCGHAPMMERPEKFTELVKNFLLSLDQQNRSTKQMP